MTQKSPIETFNALGRAEKQALMSIAKTGQWQPVPAKKDEIEAGNQRCERDILDMQRKALEKVFGTETVTSRTYMRGKPPAGYVQRVGKESGVKEEQTVGIQTSLPISLVMHMGGEVLGHGTGPQR